MTFFKQVKRTLNFKLEIRVSQEPRAGLKTTSFPESSCGRVGGKPVNEVGLRVGGP